MTHRKQTVLVGKTSLSDWGLAENGVPQGSVLGPLLFQIYINDISTSILTCFRLLFADDLQIYFSFPIDKPVESIALIRADIDRIFNWSRANSLTLNASKTKAIFFGHRHFLSQIDLTALPSICGDIPLVSSVTILGSTMDSLMTWEPQVTSVLNKVNRCTGSGVWQNIPTKSSFPS